jgi:DNA mismatch endonuclease (patch repair protein)
MADVHSKEIRSKNMAAIKGKNTKPGEAARKFHRVNGFRYKLHDKSLPGKPYLSMNSKATNKEDFYFGWYKILKCKSER